MASQSRTSRTSSPQKICIIRLSSIGDVAKTIPAVVLIRDTLRTAQITWIISPVEYELTRHLTGIEWVVIDKKTAMHAVRTLHRIPYRFDVLLLMHDSLRANLISLFVRASRRIGYRYPHHSSCHRLFIHSGVGEKRTSFSVTQQSFARAMGADRPPPHPIACYSATDHAFATAHIDKSHPTVVISPCTNDPIRQWHIKGYAAVADYAVQRHGMQVIITGDSTSAQRHTVQEICTLATSNLCNLCGQTTIGQLSAVIAAATVVISPDSASAHIAALVGTPVIGLYAVTNPDYSGPEHNRQWCVNAYPQLAHDTVHRSASDPPLWKKYRTPHAAHYIKEEKVCAMLDKVLQAHSVYND